MRAVTVSLHRDEHPPLKLTFSQDFTRLPAAEQVRTLGTLTRAFGSLHRAAASALHRGFLPALHRLQADLPGTVEINIGRTHK